MTDNSDLRLVAKDAAERLADATAAEILAWTADTFDARWIVASSMQDAVLLHLAACVRPDVEVLFLDTGYHFPETLGTRDAVAVQYPELRIVNAAPKQSAADQEAQFGPLNTTDPDRCCALRKVAPLQQTLSFYDAWVTGARRADATTRASLPVVGWDERNGLVKVNPLAAWSDETFAEYVAEHDVLVNPLLAEGYPSIGCAPCTTKPLPGADPRSGRWAGLAKTECGLHT